MSSEISSLYSSIFLFHLYLYLHVRKLNIEEWLVKITQSMYKLLDRLQEKASSLVLIEEKLQEVIACFTSFAGVGC